MHGQGPEFVRDQYRRWVDWATDDDYRTYLCVFFVLNILVVFNVAWGALW